MKKPERFEEWWRTHESVVSAGGPQLTATVKDLTSAAWQLGREEVVESHLNSPQMREANAALDKALASMRKAFE